MVEGARLEIVCAVTHRRFESCLFRQNRVAKEMPKRAFFATCWAEPSKGFSFPASSKKKNKFFFVLLLGSESLMCYNVGNMPGENETIIRLEGLTKRYGYGDAASFALKDFDLTVKRGEFIMIMGPSGCGKTTLLNIIGLLDTATSGAYYLNDEPVSRISARRQAWLRAKKIGFIFQNFNLIPDLPIIENVSLPLVYSGYHKTRRLIKASEALDRFNLKEKEYYMPFQLSGGQQQRAAIARAIVAKPEIILADEPTGNLDSHSSTLVMEELKRIHSEGNTIIMVTHNPSLTVYATRVINMLDGAIDTDVKTVKDSDLPVRVEEKTKKHKKKNKKKRGRR